MMQRFLVSVLMLLVVGSIQAQTIVISDASVPDVPWAPETALEVTVSVDFPTDLAGYSFALAWDADRLMVNEWNSNPAIPSPTFTAGEFRNDPVTIGGITYPAGSGTVGVVFDFVSVGGYLQMVPGSPVIIGSFEVSARINAATGPVDFGLWTYIGEPGIIPVNGGDAHTQLVFNDPGTVAAYGWPSPSPSVTGPFPDYTPPQIAIIPTIIATFTAGDTDGDSALTVVDAIQSLRMLFLGEPLPCFLSADFTSDGDVGIVDPIAELTHLFLGGPIYSGTCAGVTFATDCALSGCP